MVNTVTESDEQIFHCTGSNSEGSADGSVFLDYKCMSPSKLLSNIFV